MYKRTNERLDEWMNEWECMYIHSFDCYDWDNCFFCCSNKFIVLLLVSGAPSVLTLNQERMLCPRGHNFDPTNGRPTVQTLHRPSFCLSIVHLYPYMSSPFVWDYCIFNNTPPAINKQFQNETFPLYGMKWSWVEASSQPWPPIMMVPLANIDWEDKNKPNQTKTKTHVTFIHPSKSQWGKQWIVKQSIVKLVLHRYTKSQNLNGLISLVWSIVKISVW